MFLNNTMRLFDPYPGRPNSVDSGKKMLSSMSPTLVLKNQRPFLAIGCPGGTKIFNAVLQAIVNVIDHQLPLQEAVEAPRIHAGTAGLKVNMESGFPPESVQALLDRGHQIETLPAVAGGMHAILFDTQTTLMQGAACWRADGAAMGFSGGEADAEKRLW
jgi:gamma-glutamyltranspeptidase/glutathione hydrolase